MTEYQKAEAGLFYDAHKDPEVDRGRRRSQELSYQYNQLAPSQLEEREHILRENLGYVGKNCVIEQPFHCDFWERVSVGDNFFSNYNFVVLAGNKITIGDNVWIAPDCGLYAAGHPFDVELRLSGIEYAWPIKIEDNVWIGGGVKIMGGVTIGANSVIAAGSIVTKDIPANVLAAGNPCRVIREIRPEDDEKYHRGYQKV
ncbi:MAG: sugar O-acetyltransferase [Faecalimonas sp.]|nr:sugar O-acetyltransferase [Faecalimonas sp.]